MNMGKPCPSCRCATNDGTLCWECSSALETMFAAIPQLVDELQVAISKQSKVGGAGKGGLARERSPINFGVLAVRDALLVELALWGTDVDDIRKHPQAAEIVSGVGRVVKDAYRAIDRMVDRQYLGQCEATEDEAVCHAELWVKPGAHRVRCSQCETVHEVSAKREELLDRAEDLIVTPREASRYIGAVGGMDVGHQRIRNYLDRKRVPIRPSSDNELRLRLGDLLAVLREDSAKRDARAS